MGNFPTASFNAEPPRRVAETVPIWSYRLPWDDLLGFNGFRFKVLFLEDIGTGVYRVVVI